MGEAANDNYYKSLSVYGSSRPEVFCKKDVLRNFVKFTGKHQSLLISESLNFTKFLRTPFIIKHLWWLLLCLSMVSITREHDSLICSALREKCPYLELFWSKFSHIWTEYREIRSNSTYTVRMRKIAHTFYAVQCFVISYIRRLQFNTQTGAKTTKIKSRRIYLNV